MNKKTKMLIGVGAVALVGYYFWNKSQNKSFANLTSSKMMGSSTRPLTACKLSPANYSTYTDGAGKTLYDCCGVGKVGYALGKLVDTCAVEGGVKGGLF